MIKAIYQIRKVTFGQLSVARCHLQQLQGVDVPGYGGKATSWPRFTHKLQLTKTNVSLFLCLSQ